MGLNITSIRYHVYLKKKGVKFDRVALLGRQSFYGVTSNDLLAIAKENHLDLNASTAQSIIEDENGYTEPFYAWLGAHQVDSFDASDYEGANHLWDMNEPLPMSFRENYDFVFDGGTLEHVFNFPAALREAMSLVAVQGHFLSAVPANSYLGHGLYQIGPDLASEVLSNRNGFEAIGVYLVEDRLNPVFYEVTAPSPSRGRVLVSCAWPTNIYFCGRRVSDIPERLQVSQPDYSLAWSQGVHSERPIGNAKTILLMMLRWLPENYRNFLLRSCKHVIVSISRNSFWGCPGIVRVRDI
jgi:hypothetical protein